MESFYRFLGGPRTFLGGSKTIINNNFIGGMPMMRAAFRPCHMPFFGGHCFGGASKAFNLMLGFGLASSLIGNITGLFSKQNNNLNNMYYDSLNNYYYPGYTPANNYNNYINSNNLETQYLTTLNSKVENLEEQLSRYQKELDNIKKNQTEQTATREITPDKSVPADEIETVQDIPETETIQEENKYHEPINNVEENKSEQTITPTNAEQDEIEIGTEIKPEESPKTLDDYLNNAGFDKLDSTAQNYVKSRISNAYLDENGNVKYDIKAIVHDGDNLNSIIDRFYSKDEKSSLEVAKAKLHTQGSETRLIVNPLSGDTIIANGVSEYGLKALMLEAKNGITRQGEITKTNKKIANLKTAFINGENKLSRAYVLQNKLMSEAEYNKIIKEKYSS